MFTIQRIQKQLTELGYQLGPIDGVRGRLTIAALQQFQRARGLNATGIADAVTLSELFPKADIFPQPSKLPDYAPWMKLALQKKGLQETTHKKTLMEFLKLGKGTIGDPAVTPWCGDFVETCIAVTMPTEPLPANPYAAINFMKFGIACAPQYGAILVFWRGTPNGWQGHIGFYVGEDATHYHVLGGNQSNAVTITRIAKDRLRAGGCRWPSTAMAPSGKPVILSPSGVPVTTNEA